MLDGGIDVLCPASRDDQYPGCPGHWTLDGSVRSWTGDCVERVGGVGVLFRE